MYFFQSKKVWILLCSLILLCGCTQKPTIHLANDSKCEIVNQEKMERMVQHGTGIVLFLEKDQDNQSIVNKVEELAKKVDVPVYISFDHPETIQKFPSITFTNKGKEIGKLDTNLDTSEMEEYFVKVKEARDRNNQAGCGEHCKFSPSESPSSETKQ